MITRTTISRASGILIIVLLAASCNTQKVPLQSVDTSGLYRDTTSTDTSTLANTPWTQLFTDKQLQVLIREGLENNFNLQVTMKKVEEAEAYFKQSRAQLLPSVSVVGNASYSKNSKWLYPSGPLKAQYYAFGAEASWELDIWGKLSSAKRAAYANLLGSDAGRKAVQTRLISDIASGYFNLLSLDAKLDITRQTVKTSIELVETMKALKENGAVNGAAVVQSEAARYAAEVTIPDLEQQALEQENALSLLVGQKGGTIARSKLDEQPQAPLMHTGVPSQLLENRPDVVESEYQVITAYETTRSARAYFYPSLTITASAGLESVNLDKLFDPASVAASILGGLIQPIFNKRANIARLKVAKLQQEEALLNFKSTLYNAGNEVQDALGSYQSADSKLKLRTLELDALVKSVEYTKQLLRYGTANYIEVLNAQQSLLSAQLGSVNDHLQQLNAVVSLYRALGGGWK